MSAGAGKNSRLESLLASLLHYGTQLATSLIGAGLVFALIKRYTGVISPAMPFGTHLVTLGIVCLILLPVSRVMLMLVIFVRERDYRFVVIVAIVLMIILMGFVLGVCLPKSPPTTHSLPADHSKL